jgi:hypothetical protein
MITNSTMTGEQEDNEKRRVVIDTAIAVVASGELVKDAVEKGYDLLEELEESGTWDA